MENKKTKPVAEVKFGLIAASIWKNESKNGAYYNVTILTSTKTARRGNGRKASGVTSS
jgi:hypothetical protein